MRLVWLDQLKIFGTLLVILGHINSPFSSLIYSFHMPLFFIASGMFVSNCFKYEMTSGFKRLIIPYFIFSLLGILITVLKNIALSRPIDFLDYMSGVFFWFDMESLKDTYAFVLWFLPALYISRVFISYLVRTIRSQYLLWVVLIVAFLVGREFQLPFAIDDALMALPWLAIGRLYRNVHFRNNFNLKATLSLLILSLIYYSYGVPHLDIATKSYEPYFLVNFLWASLIFIILRIVFETISLSRKYVEYLISGSLFFYVIHPYTNNIAHILVETMDLSTEQWIAKLSISLFLIWLIYTIRVTLGTRGILKYV